MSYAADTHSCNDSQKLYVIKQSFRGYDICIQYVNSHTLAR